MTLTRHWYPTSNKSNRSGTPRLLVVHTTEGFTGSNGMYDCAIYFQGPVGASSHVVIDNYHPGHICECVSPSYVAWTQCHYNNATASSVEQCAYASYSRDKWLGEFEPLLRNTAAWLSEESRRWNIPLIDLSASQAQGSGRGVCYHSDLGSAGCGHSDPGNGYPLDVVLQWASGDTSSTPQEALDVSAAIAYDPNGHAHYAWLNTKGQIVYAPPGREEGYVIDPNQSGAKSGLGLAIGKDWLVTTIYTNSSGAVCEYYKTFNVGDWVWRGISPGNSAR